MHSFPDYRSEPINLLYGEEDEIYCTKIEQDGCGTVQAKT
jgi:hypothetical protein